MLLFELSTLRNLQNKQEVRMSYKCLAAKEHSTLCSFTEISRQNKQLQQNIPVSVSRWVLRDRWGNFEMENTHRSSRVFSHWVKKTSKFLSPGRVKDHGFLSGFSQNSAANNRILPGFSKIFGFGPG